VQLSSASRVTVTWRRCKGGKTLHDILAPAVAGALVEWMRAAYGADLARLDADAAIWLSLSANQTHRAAIERPATIGAICYRRLGVSKVHTTRHTFAATMEQLGAKVSDIQARLGHASLATTGRYLQALHSAENAHADALAGIFGVTSSPAVQGRAHPRGRGRGGRGASGDGGKGRSDAD
jgi:integrase